MPPTRSKYFQGGKTVKSKAKTKIFQDEDKPENIKVLKIENDEDDCNETKNQIINCETNTESDRIIEEKQENTTFENRLTDKFFDVPCIELAKKLLGKILVRAEDNRILMKGKIVETECYLGGSDKASHSHNNRMTPKNKPMFMKPGSIYVYLTYGMYHCINISSQGPGAAVLIRALEPIEGIETIMKYRLEFGNKKEASKSRQEIKIPQLCNGPGKLCVGFNINKTFTEQDICTSNRMWIENSESDISDTHIVISKRIGIDSVDEPWRSSPLRFYIYNCPYVSKRDKEQEEINKRLLSEL